MSALTSLLARDRIVSVSKIEEALQQQVLSGGDIETVLLEMNLVQEDVLSAYRAALFGLLPATREEVMRASREALRQLPLELARRLCLIPILHEGRSLVLAGTEPLNEAVARQLRAELGCEISVRIVNSVRLAVGLAHHYGVDIDARTRRLTDVLRKRDPGVIPYVRPPTPGARPSLLPLAAFDDEPDSREMPILSERSVTALRVDMKAMELPPSLSMPVPQAEPLAGAPETLAREEHEAEEEDAEARHEGRFEESESNELVSESAAGVEAHGQNPEPFGYEEGAQRESHAFEPQETQASPRLAFMPPANSADSEELEEDVQPFTSQLPRPSLSGFQAERAATLPPVSVAPNLARALRGPISQDRAESLLEETIHRDEVLYVLLRYAQQFFEFVAIFSVGKSDVRGRMAHGAGLSQELMEHLVIPLSEGGFAARVVAGLRPVVGDWAASDEERAALALLGRPAGRPGLAVPLAIGARVALLLYVDRLHEGLAAGDAEPLVELAPAIDAALKRIIVEQKTLRGRSARASAEPAPDEASKSSSRAEPRASVDVEREAEREASHADVRALDDLIAREQSSVSSEKQSAVVELEGEHPLTPVDLHAVSRLSFAERRRTVSETSPGTRGVPSAVPSALDVVRGRVAGVPRSAPPPPQRDSVPPGPDDQTPESNQATPLGASHGAYSFVAATGAGAVMEENVRLSPRQQTAQPRQQAAQPRALNLAASQEAQAILAIPEAAVAAAPPVVTPSVVTPDNEQTSASPPATEGLEASAPGREQDLEQNTEAAAPGGAAVRGETYARADVRAPRLSLVSADAVVPSVIIDMGDQVNTLVEALLHAGATDPIPEIAELVRLGEGALPVLMQHFPGPLWLDLPQAERRKARGRELSAVARCLVAFREKAAPYIASKLATSEAAQCKMLLMVAGEIVHSELLEAVARRTFDADESVRAVALEALRNYNSLPQFDAVLRAICDLSSRPGKDPRRQRIALEALLALRDPRALRTLIARLLDPSDKMVRAAHKALVLLTAQDQGLAARKWEQWAEQVAGTHRVEWLIDGLTQNDEALRTLAGEELKQLTQQYFGYHPSLPKRDRELAQRKYREWWEQEGKAQFHS